MKNKTEMPHPRSQNKALDWLEQREMEEDFLVGKTPSEFQGLWEDEE